MFTLSRVRGQTKEVELLTRNRLSVCSVMGGGKTVRVFILSEYDRWSTPSSPDTLKWLICAFISVRCIKRKKGTLYFPPTKAD